MASISTVADTGLDLSLADSVSRVLSSFFLAWFRTRPTGVNLTAASGRLVVCHP
jgi:hypothetical protein